MYSILFPLLIVFRLLMSSLICFLCKFGNGDTYGYIHQAATWSEASATGSGCGTTGNLIVWEQSADVWSLDVFAYMGKLLEEMTALPSMMTKYLLLLQLDLEHLSIQDCIILPKQLAQMQVVMESSNGYLQGMTSRQQTWPMVEYLVMNEFLTNKWGK